MEACYGCGAMAQKAHPILGIVNTADVDPAFVGTIANPNTVSAFVGVPVCRACHEDPAHRTTRALKVHFAERDKPQHLVGLILAGSSELTT